ncbi:hypothetical protein [Sphingomonas abietis]|uniref:Uncharacterized protein n=1 Tax=Sphingomonas abietis TaxID=3012344 RepID=A0ABY7NQV0_9SPHN|nr:hypothetical protein [Sphingomonas abietis]WBO23922.1 hypothetical protein PBT88_07380 [Sphingomonas abietis]
MTQAQSILAGAVLLAVVLSRDRFAEIWRSFSRYNEVRATNEKRLRDRGFCTICERRENVGTDGVCDDCH